MNLIWKCQFLLPFRLNLSNLLKRSKREIWHLVVSSFFENHVKLWKLTRAKIDLKAQKMYTNVLKDHKQRRSHIDNESWTHKLTNDSTLYQLNQYSLTYRLHLMKEKIESIWTLALVLITTPNIIPNIFFHGWLY